MKKILFNCSTNVQGGPVQNAANFILASKEDKDFIFYYVISPEVYSMIKKKIKGNERVTIINKSPSKSLVSRRLIKNIENNISPDLVFTMAGPSYVNFKSRHLMGCSNPYLLFAKTKDILFGRSLIEFLMRECRTIYQKYYLKKAHFYLFQTEYSKNIFSSKYSISEKKLFHVPNSLGFIKDKINSISVNKEILNNKKIKVLCPFENYPHKGLHVLPIMDELFKKMKVSVEFEVTVSPNNLSKRQLQMFKNKPNIRFIGKQPYEMMVNAYMNNHVVFLPSVLEVFSSITIEALHFMKPIVLSDKEFNREIIEKYAIYCNPFSPIDCVEKILIAFDLVNDTEYLEKARKFVIKKYNSYDERLTKLKRIFREITN